MSKTVSMVPVGRQPVVHRPSCTACRRPLLDAVAVLKGEVRTDALACSGCLKLGVHCSCPVAA